MLGRKYMGVVRASFLIDQAGNVEKVFAKVKATRHPGEVVDLLRHPPST
jgi:peroxiredoxin